MAKVNPIPNLDLQPLHLIPRSLLLLLSPNLQDSLDQPALSTYQVCISRVIPYEHKGVRLGERRSKRSIEKARALDEVKDLCADQFGKHH